MGQVTFLLVALFLMWTLTNLGMIFDGSSSAWVSEIFRNLLYLVFFGRFLAKAWLQFMIPSSVVLPTYGLSLAVSLTRFATSFIGTNTQTNSTDGVNRKSKVQ